VLQPYRSLIKTYFTEIFYQIIDIFIGQSKKVPFYRSMYCLA